jgi:hypothetical protein
LDGVFVEGRGENFIKKVLKRAADCDFPHLWRSAARRDVRVRSEPLRPLVGGAAVGALRGVGAVVGVVRQLVTRERCFELIAQLRVLLDLPDQCGEELLLADEFTSELVLIGAPTGALLHSADAPLEVVVCLQQRVVCLPQRLVGLVADGGIGLLPQVSDEETADHHSDQQQKGDRDENTLPHGECGDLVRGPRVEVHQVEPFSRLAGKTSVIQIISILQQKRYLFLKKNGVDLIIRVFFI